MYEFWGQHCLCDMEGIYKIDLSNTSLIVNLLEKAIVSANATLVETICHQFIPEGSSILAVLKESHVAIHIYPEYHAMFLDAFTCGKTADPEKIVIAFIEQLVPKSYNFQTIIRTLPSN